MNNAERAVAIVDLRDQDAEAEQIHDIEEAQALSLHLFVDAVEILLTADDTRTDAFFLQCPLELVLDLLDQALGVAKPRVDRFLEDLVALRIQVLERKIFEFHAQRVDAEALRDRRVDLQRFQRHPTTLGRLDTIERADVVQAIGKFDEDDAQILRHRQQQLADVLRLALRARHPFDLLELRDAVDQLGDIAAEQASDLFLANRRVLDHVMEDRRAQCGRVQPHLSKDLGDRERVVDVRLAARPVLTGVHLGAKFVGPAHLGNLRCRQVLLEQPRQRIDAVLARDALRADSGADARNDGDVHDPSIDAGVALPRLSATKKGPCGPFR